MSSSASHRKSGKNGEHSSVYKALKIKPSKDARESRNRKRKVENDDFVQPQTHTIDLTSETSSSSDNEEETDYNGNKTYTNVISQKNSRKRRRTSSSECCAICLEYFNRKNEKYFLNCGHYFHCPCIKQWLGLQKTCPTCRAIISDCDED